MHQTRVIDDVYQRKDVVVNFEHTRFGEFLDVWARFAIRTWEEGVIIEVYNDLGEVALKYMIPYKALTREATKND